MIHGILPLYKPVSMSSYDVIRTFKSSLADKKQKIGHAGTLDVFASGVLILLLGDMTKEFDYFQSLEKEYRASVRLGYYSNTQDIEGVLVEQTDSPSITINQIKTAASKFIGTYNQAVPVFSAAKHQGKPLYKLAREGKLITKFKEVTINDITIEQYKNPLVSIKVSCGSGTYIRQLAYDIFKEIHVESFLWQLERTRVGEIGIPDCALIEDLQNDTWENFLFTTDEDAV